MSRGCQVSGGCQVSRGCQVSGGCQVRVESKINGLCQVIAGRQNWRIQGEWRMSGN